MANEQNLIPQAHKLTVEEASKGGKASGVARRRKRALREAIDLYLSLPVKDVDEWNKLSDKGIDPEDIDNQMAVIVGLANSAKMGDSKSAKVLFDILADDKHETAVGEKQEDDPLTKALKEEAERMNDGKL